MGYLECDKCGGYYELQEGESPEDFDSCECGGKLKYKSKIDNESTENNDLSVKNSNNSKESNSLKSWWNKKTTGKKFLTVSGGIIGITFLILLALFFMSFMDSGIDPANLDNIHIVKSAGNYDVNPNNEKIGYEITGFISNNNSYNVDDIKIEVTFYDKSGNVIKTETSKFTNSDIFSSGVSFWTYAKKNSDGSYSLWEFESSRYIPKGAIIPFRIYLNFFDIDGEKVDIAKYSIRIINGTQSTYNQMINGTYIPMSSKRTVSPSKTNSDSSKYGYDTYDSWYEFGRGDGVVGLPPEDEIPSEWESAYMDGWIKGNAEYERVQNAFNN